MINTKERILRKAEREINEEYSIFDEKMVLE